MKVAFKRPRTVYVKKSKAPKLPKLKLSKVPKVKAMSKRNYASGIKTRFGKSY